jgi:Domain of unknown function (DUF4158)
MASIERTAYPRFKPSLTANELQALYAPSEEEREFVAMHARGAAQQLTLLMLLKGLVNLLSVEALIRQEGVSTDRDRSFMLPLFP